LYNKVYALEELIKGQAEEKSDEALDSDFLDWIPHKTIQNNNIILNNYYNQTRKNTKPVKQEKSKEKEKDKNLNMNYDDLLSNDFITYHANYEHTNITKKMNKIKIKNIINTKLL